MECIERRWSPDKIQIIYVDGLVTDCLLENLNISNSCILHGDYFHLFKENWPKSENFGRAAFNLIKAQLSKMLLSKTKEEWDKAFSEAKEILVPYPTKLSLLQNIYDKPKYYSGYITRHIIGNLNLNGTVFAEQNHASVINHFGETMLGNIVDHLKSLMQRQQFLCNKENDLEATYLVESYKYNPSLDGDFGVEERKAREILSSTPFKEFFIPQLKASEYLVCDYDDSSRTYKIWPAAVSFSESDADHVTIKTGDRCLCWRRVDLNIQCKHEFCISPKFEKRH